MEDKIKALKEQQKARLIEIIEEKQKEWGNYKCRVFCCNSTSCKSSGVEPVIDSFLAGVKANDLEGLVEIVPTGCMGLCAEGPLVRVEVKGQAPIMYKKVEPLIARLIVAEHIKASIMKGSDFALPEILLEHTLSLDLPFFAQQTKIVLKELGQINPEKIEDYIAVGGYKALQKCLFELTPQQVIEEMKKSGLRGRGGAGFPTGLKWEFGNKAQADEKFVICNGDEGDPGAYMDSCMLEGNPHSVLEGMMISAYAQGAQKGWFYIRAEYPLAVKRMENAIKQAKKYGLLGQQILGSEFSFDAEIRLGAGAFVCGEETALINSIEGKRGTPRPRPPFPAQKGLWQKPSTVNNVETFANVAKIINMGGEEYAKIGTEKSKGTKVFALTGRVNYGGLVEVPMGMTIRRIVEVIGQGVTPGHTIKAVQTGGPSGGVIPESLIDLPVCYDELQKVGSIMGSGGMIVMQDDDSLVDIAKFYLEFAVDESCGKCAPCRVGGRQMLNLLTKIADGKGSKEDLVTLNRLATAMKKASLCGLGQTTPNPVLSTLKYFENEYLDKISENKSNNESCLAKTNK